MMEDLASGRATRSRGEAGAGRRARGRLVVLIFVLFGLAIQLDAVERPRSIEYHNGDDTNVGTFIQFGDVHYDQDYTTQGSTARYCRGVVPPEQQNGCLPYGTPLSGADSPRSLVAEALSAVGSLTNQLKPDFILWSGDTGRHSATSPDDIYAETTMVTSLLRQATNNYPWVLPVLGNNDCFDNCVGEKENDSITRNFTQIWSSYLKHVDSGQDFFRGGYMYTKISNQLLVLSLNTMFWTQRNCALNDQTACGLPNSPGAVQFEWMEKVVSDPAHKHMSLILHGHIPPLAAPLNGDKVFFSSCLEKYHSFTKNYKDRIKGHLYADKHIDAFYVMPNNIGTVLVNPAVVPLFNPGIRVFSYDRKTGDILNYWQHYINVTKANDGAKPTLELEYSPLSPYHGSGGGSGGDPPGYGLKDLSQASWDWLNNMIVDNTTLKLLFERYFFVSYPVALPRGNREEAAEELLHGQWAAHRKRQSACHCSPWPTS